ncbi:LysM peptidoglycan-binding domain-containing protein [Paenibacillus sp.]|uniref:LysM peptidoglycan-binding domain-containing protein n=1 Tax=Paenibacillus sp. TaxID=58172 RepID=UPI002D7272C5|nr:LysM peptidoglycan-binding domain-containing protein [Paenibacillus sp.]HZG87061.1 LysM peptidoglycan-binding domain-containing protein [Paenibacillus sp.]
MSQPTSGLRFDIYERVHLSDDTVGIREITGVELAPDISVVAQGEQAVLKGHLVLSGTYVGEDETRSGEETLTHRIPVEITLPLSRVDSVADIRVEIENFDVDVLSSRSLNVTGVLSLEGVSMSSPAETDWREEEEVVFTHRVEQPPQPEPQPAPQPAPHQSPAQEPVVTIASAETPPPAVALPEIAAAEANEPEAAISAAANEPAMSAANEAAISAANEPAIAAAAEEPANEPPQTFAAETFAAETFAAEAEAAQEKQEIKIAFAGKPAAQEEPIGVNAIMSFAGASAAAARQEAAAPQQAPNVEPAENRDRLEWRKLFLATSSEAPSFRRVRMCIAQKEDTLETIAERYNKSARELMLYNRLSGEYLQEGQVVYIP